MKQRTSFWRSIERYGWRAIGRVSPLLPSLVGMIVLFMVFLSFTSHKNSVVGLRSLTEVIEKAARAGDYALAQKLDREVREMTTNEVLGVNSELEDLIYPERVVQREIARYEELLFKYPGHRDIYLVLSRLYEQINMTEQSENYYNLARELDPNNSVFSE